MFVVIFGKINAKPHTLFKIICDRAGSRPDEGEGKNAMGRKNTRFDEFFLIFCQSVVLGFRVG